MDNGALVGQTRQCQRRAEHRQPERSERHEAILDLAAGQIAGGETAGADPKGQCDLEVAGAFFADVQCVHAKHHHVVQRQQADEREINIAEQREPEHPVAADFPDLPEQIGKKIGVEFFRRIRGWQFRQSEAAHQTEPGQGEEHQRGELLPPDKGGIEQPAHRNTGNDRRERAEFEDAVAPRQPFLREEFR